MSRRRKRKARWTWLRYRRGDVAHNLLVAAQRYIHANGGTAVVLGGISVIQLDPRPHCYHLAVGFMGKNLDPTPPQRPAANPRRRRP